MRHRTSCIALLGFLVATAVAGEPLRYRIPPGWLDLADSSVDVSAYPANTVREARSGKYRIYAIDPSSVTPQGAAALMNVIELDSTGRMTSEVVRRAAQEAFERSRSMGYDMMILDTRLAKLGDVDIGIVDSTLGNAAGKLRLVQYFIPGKPRSAVMTYGCAPSELDRYRPIFEASAMATTGAYARPAFDWQRTMKGAFEGALIGGIVGAVAFLTKRRARTSAAAPAPSPVTWECPTCRRRVPSRISECRCGTPRPAGGAHASSERPSTFI
jgi:hypothetical protein